MLRKIVKTNSSNKKCLFGSNSTLTMTVRISKDYLQQLYKLTKAFSIVNSSYAKQAQSNKNYYKIFVSSKLLFANNSLFFSPHLHLMEMYTRLQGSPATEKSLMNTSSIFLLEASFQLLNNE